MKPRTFLLLASIHASASLAAAASADAYPEYTPSGLETGELHCVGSPTLDTATLAWMEIFREGNPEFEEATIEARGNETIVPAFVSASGQIGPASRSLFPAELDAFVKKFGYPPTAIRACGGAYSKIGYSPALAIYANQDNPITQLSLGQLEEIFAVDGRITTWGQLGLTGEWTHKVIDLFGLPQPNGISCFLQEAAMHGRPFRKGIFVCGRTGRNHTLNSMVIAVANDRYALTYAAGDNAKPGTKKLAIAVQDGAPGILPTLQSVTDRSYPLSRCLYLYINRPPGQPLDPNVKEFLHVALSRQGQEALAHRSFFLPLPPQLIREELAKVDAGPLGPAKPDANVTIQGGTPAEFHEPNPVKAETGIPAYAPSGTLSGALSSIGTDSMEDTMKFWASGFARHQPNVSVSIEAKGSMTGEPALTAGRCQLAPESREMFRYEVDRFKAKHGYEPLAIKVALGAYRTPERSDALAIYVNKRNPIERLSFEQLAAIYSASSSPRYPNGVTTWGQLGLEGEWANRRIQPVGVVPADGNSAFIQHFVCGDAEYRGGIKGEGIGPYVKVWVRILSDIADDPAAIGYSSFLYPNPDTKRIAVAAKAEGPYLQGTFDEVASARYPLTRFVYIYVDRAPGKALAPQVREFLRYVLSLEGQQCVEKDHGFMPLPARLVREERAKID